MKDPWKTYFAFSKKERAGIVVLLALLGVLLILPWVLQDVSVKADTMLLNRLYGQLTGLHQPKPSIATWVHHRDSSRTAPDKYHKRSAPIVVELFEFDPNTLPEKDWQRLGLSERSVQTILKYISKGGRFRRPEDLGKMYSLRPEEVQRLMPYVRIESSRNRSYATLDSLHYSGRKDFFKQAGSDNFSSDHKSKKRTYPLQPIDINRSDTTTWIALPGIGSKLAQRVVSFREKLGGFHSVEQVAETYGLPDSTFQQIRSLLHCTQPQLKTIDINSADVQILKQHPYIRWHIANAIIRYREQHGPFQSVDELERIVLITHEIRQKILPYLRAGE